MSAHAPSPAPPGDGIFGGDGKGVPMSAPGYPGQSDAPEHASNGRPQPPARRSTALLPSRASSAQNAKDREPTRSLSKTSSAGAAVTSAPPTGVGMDPLSTQIYLRTNSSAEPSIAQRLRNPSRPESPPSDNLHDVPAKPPNGTVDAIRERRKGASFLSRLSMRGVLKKDDDMPDSDSELGDFRTDGSNARAMTSIVGAAGGYIPLFKEPPRYIRVRSYNKKGKDFNRLFLAQELLSARPPTDDEMPGRAPATVVGTKILKAGDAIWAAEFSVDGRYLAVAGKDQMVRVFSVISTPEDRRAHEKEEEECQSRGAGERLSAPVFRSKPAREFEGHTGEILALSWSKNNFLLSSSMDKTVRLWHMSRKECLCVFTHSDLVTSIAFHPTDDRFFLAGSLDAQLRLWSIPDKAVAFAAQTSEFITAVAFSPDGKTAICGVLSGLCMFYETEGLKFQFQIHVRSSRGKNAKGSKITGIRTARMPPDVEGGDIKVLVSSNDSRVRIYSLRTRMLEVKFRGLENQSSQIHARFSDDGTYVISGSEDRRAYIWRVANSEAELKDKQPYECFDAHPEVVTTALMAPVKTRQLLSASGDPIYDLCNPPPVMLLSPEEEKTASQAGNVPDSGGRPEPAAGAKTSPAYVERTKHPHGNIVVTTDRTGTIKVFRQDCAFAKRQQNMWETGSKFSGKLASVGRSASIITKTSGGSRGQSRRGSLNLGSSGMLVQPVSDRIMSWRQDIEGRAGPVGIARSERSMSPIKASRSSVNTSAANLASEARRLPYASGLAPRSGNPASPTSSVQTSRASLRLAKDKEATLPPTPSFSLISAASDSDHQHEDKGEGGFWNLSRWKGGISGLRYSANAALSGGTATQAATPNPTGTDGQGPAPGSKAAARRSMGVGDLRKLRLGDDNNRRKSVEPDLSARPRFSESDSAARSLQAEPGTVDKQRTEPSLAQLSLDSTDDSDNTACRECGKYSLKTKKTGKDRTTRVCEWCGATAGS